MKVWVDQSLCVGNGVCVDLSPDVFMIDAGLAFVLDNGRPLPANAPGEVPDHLLDATIAAAEECPAECIYFEP